jgi:hypothetical protein
MQRNRDFIRSGRASMFGPRPATTKGILALRGAGIGAGSYGDGGGTVGGGGGLAGLRGENAVDLERVKQEGEIRRAWIGAKKDAYIERGKSNAARRDAQEARAAAAAEAAAEREHKKLMEELRQKGLSEADARALAAKQAEWGAQANAKQEEYSHLRGMQSDLLADNQAARAAAAEEAEAGRKHEQGLTGLRHANEMEMENLRQKGAADLRTWQGEQNALDRNENARQFDANMGLLRSQEQQAQAQRDFDQNNVQNAENINGVWGVRQPDGTVRVFSPEYQQHLTDRYSKDVAGAVFNPKSGQWESHNIPVDRSLVAPREQRYAAVYEKLSKLDHPEYWTIALNRYGKPDLTPRGAQLANGWQEVPEEDRGYIEWLTMPR